MSASRGTKVVFVLVALFAIGAGTALYLRERDEESLRKEEEASGSDASVDGSAKVAKGKAPPKKKAARGGKTRVTARGGTGGGARAGGGAHAPAAGGGHAPAPGPTTSPARDDPGSSGGQNEEPSPTSASHGAPHHHAPRHYPSGPSYESALDSNNHEVNMGGRDGPDLSDAQLSGPMSDGAFISDCGAPDDMGVTVKVAIKNGRAVGVSVTTSPHSAEVAGCIGHHVRGLSWPSSPKMDSFVTTY